MTLNKASCWLISAYLLVIVACGTFAGSLWRIDPHHDGFTYLPAKFAEIGIFPPGGAGSNYGIAQAVFEGAILNFIPDYFIFYRLIAVILILISGFLIFRIISLESQKLQSALFTLVWLFANPTWQNSINIVPQSIQSVWPNLWIQTLTLLALYITNRKILNNKVNFITLGIILATLPFIRIQGAISTVFLLILIKIKTKKLKLLIVFYFCTTIFWLTLITVSGGIEKYYQDIFLKPLNGLVDFSSFEYFFNFGRSLLNYYVVITSVSILFFLILLKITSAKKIVSKLHILFVLIILAVAKSRNPEIWPSIFVAKSNSLVLDLAFVSSVSYAFLQRNMILKVFKNKGSNNQKNLLVLALFSAFNHINLFPLPDEGHKWWSSAITLIFLAKLIEKLRHNAIWKAYKFVHFVNIAILTSLILSSINVIFFLKIDRISIINEQNSRYNYIQYPAIDSEMVKTFELTTEILSVIETSGAQINFVCREPLYYLGHDHISNSADKAFDFLNKPYRINPNYDVNFFCNTQYQEVINLENQKYFIIGSKSPNLIVFGHKHAVYFKELIEKYSEKLHNNRQ